MNFRSIIAPLEKHPTLINILKWSVWSAIALPSIVFSVSATQAYFPELTQTISKWVYGYLNFASFVLGLIASAIIFWRKPKDWMALSVAFMLIMWTSTGDGTELFSPPSEVFSILHQQVTYFLTIPYELLLSLLALLVLLTFPNGKWTPAWTRWLFVLTVIWALLLPVYVFIMILLSGRINFSYKAWEILTGTIPELIRISVLVLGALAQLYRIWTTRNPFQRQQLKWISVSLFGMTLFYALFNIARLLNLWELESIQLLTLFMLLNFFTYGFIFTLAISVLRYRIWDIDIVINKAFVYGPLTAILGSLGIVGAIIFDFYAKKLFEDSPVVTVAALVPVVMLFSPLRNILQNFVDKRFKPEEIDFSGAIVEFSPDAQLMLTSKDILNILAGQVREQLGVSAVDIFLRHEGGGLILSEPVKDEAVDGSQVIPVSGLTLLERGEVFVPADSSQYSLYLPLTLKRASRPEFLGVIVLGSRESGIGYSTPVLESLRKFGADAGKVLYVAKLRESTGKNIIERLASIEKGLANLKTSQT